MAARQLVRRTDGSVRVQPDVGELRYVESGSRGRWQLLRFALYELRRAAVVRPSRLAAPSPSVSAITRGRAERQSARSGPTGAAGPAGLLSMREGISPGYAVGGDSARAGSFVDVTNIPPAGTSSSSGRTRPRRPRERLCEQRGIGLIQVRRAG